MAHYDDFDHEGLHLEPDPEYDDPDAGGFFPRVEAGTRLFAPVPRVADSLAGYRFNVQFCDERGVWMQQVQFTGRSTDKGLEVIVLEDAATPG